MLFRLSKLGVYNLLCLVSETIISIWAQEYKSSSAGIKMLLLCGTEMLRYLAGLIFLCSSEIYHDSFI